MKLQLALDDITLEAAVSLLHKIAEYLDIIEIGTPLLLEYGMEAVRTIKQTFPDKEVLCDAKIMDGGVLEANAAFRAGADYVTVLGVADKATVIDVVGAARKWKRRTVVDLICLEDFEKELPVLEALGMDIAAVHVGVDQQRSGRTPLQDLIRIKAIAKRARVAVAGGISLETVDAYIRHQPDVIIVGGAITGAADALSVTRSIYRKIQEANG